jgi:hypothetical protein
LRSVLSSAGEVFLGWLALSSAGGRADWQFGDGVYIGCTSLGEGGCSAPITGMTVCNKSWSVILYACRLVCLTCGINLLHSM